MEKADLKFLKSDHCPLCDCETVNTYRLELAELNMGESKYQEMLGLACGVLIVTNEMGEEYYLGNCTRNPRAAEDTLEQKELMTQLADYVKDSSCNPVTKGNLLQMFPIIN